MGVWSLAEEEETVSCLTGSFIVCFSFGHLAREDRGSCHHLHGNLIAVRACPMNGGLLAMIRCVTMRCCHYERRDGGVCS